MKKHFFKALALSVAVAATIGTMSVMTACNNDKPEPSGEVTVAEYYCGKIDGVDLNNFWHFNENGTYYLALYDGGFKDAGTWELKEGNCDYWTATKTEGEAEIVDATTKKTASHYIEISSYTGDYITHNWTSAEGETATKLALDNNTIYVGSTMSSLIKFEADSTFTDPNGTESNFRVEVQKLYADNSETKTLLLYHDLSYEDLTGAEMSSGTYTIATNGTYTLKDETTEATKTLTVNADGTATYGEATLRNKLLVDVQFTGSITLTEISGSVVGQAWALMSDADKNVSITLSCNAVAGTFTLGGNINVTMISQSMPITFASGTYTEVPDPNYGGMVPAYTFTAEQQGVTITVAADITQATVTGDVTYTATITINNVDYGTDSVTGSGTATYVLNLFG